MTITRDELKVLKSADSIGIVRERVGSTYVSKILATLTADNRLNPLDRSLTREIVVDQDIVTDYGSDYSPECANMYTARLSIGLPRYHSEWRTALGAMRAGDILIIIWTRSNDNQYMVEAGITSDDCRITITRPKKNGGSSTSSYLLEYSVNKVNSPWRMIHKDAVPVSA